MTRRILPPLLPGSLHVTVAAWVALASCTACKREDAAETSPPAQPAPAVSASAPPPQRAPARPMPEMVAVPGQGLSAIRFGTNFETLARHMEAPCEIRTETRCLYIDYGLDFAMKDGVVAGMKVNRPGRKVQGLAEPRKYGLFMGVLTPSIQVGLHRHVVAEELKTKPERVEEMDRGPDGLVAREYYPGVIIEYDKIENGNVVVGGFEIVPLAGPQTGSATK